MQRPPGSPRRLGGCAELRRATRRLLARARSGRGRVCRRVRSFIVGMFGGRGRGPGAGEDQTRTGCRGPGQSASLRGSAPQPPPAACNPPTRPAPLSPRDVVSLLGLAVLGVWRCVPVLLACVSSLGADAGRDLAGSGSASCVSDGGVRSRPPPAVVGRLPCFACLAGALSRVPSRPRAGPRAWLLTSPCLAFSFTFEGFGAKRNP